MTDFLKGIDWEHVLIFIAGFAASAIVWYLVTRDTIKKALAEVPTTNAWSVLTMGAFAATAVFYFASEFAHVEIDPDKFGDWLLFLFGMRTGDVAQFRFKRGTFQPTPPAVLDQEDAKAGATVKGSAATPPASPPPIEGERGDLERGRPK